MLRVIVLALMIAATAGVVRAQQALDHLPALKGGYFRHESAAVGRPFHIFVRLPERYEAEPERAWPVVYVLDGDSLFPMLAPAHLFLTYDERLPDAVVVGVAYGGFGSEVNKRGFDFNPPEAGGGADRFSRFLADELLPTVEARWRTDPQRRVLVGQSRGGTYVLYSALTEPDVFWGRIASNPVVEPITAVEPRPATRSDLGVVVVSGERDWPSLLESRRAWLEAWRPRPRQPWPLHAVDLPGGTHAASVVEAYRAGMLWLFRNEMERR